MGAKVFGTFVSFLPVVADDRSVVGAVLPGCRRGMRGGCRARGSAASSGDTQTIRRFIVLSNFRHVLTPPPCPACTRSGRSSRGGELPQVFRVRVRSGIPGPATGGAEVRAAPADGPPEGRR